MPTLQKFVNKMGAVDFGYFYPNPKDGYEFFNWNLGLGIRSTLGTVTYQKTIF